MMNKNSRKEFRLSRETLEKFKRIKEEKNLKTDTDTFIYLINSHEERQKFAKEIAREMEVKWKKTFDRIRLASQSSEKYTYTILDILNTLLYEFPNVDTLIPAGMTTSHKVTKESMENLNEIIERRKQLKDNRGRKTEPGITDEHIYDVKKENFYDIGELTEDGELIVG